MANYLQSLLGEEEYKNAQKSALNSGLLQAGLMGLMASGPSFQPVGTGQVLGQAGMAGLGGYQEALQGAEQQALKGREFEQMMQSTEAEKAFKDALPNAIQGGKINYDMMRQLAVAYPEKVGAIMKALESTTPKAPPSVNLQFDAKTGTIFNPKTGKITRDPNFVGEANVNPQLVTVQENGQPVQRIVDLNTGRVISDVGAGAPKDFKPTATQENSAGYYDRMKAATKIIDPLEEDGEYPQLGSSLAKAMPFVGESFKRTVQSEDTQKYEQAADDWIRSKLRSESGAVIGKDEMEAEFRLYFPQVGDSDAVIKQKREARAIATEAMKKKAGIAEQQSTAKPKTKVFNPATGKVEER